ncbi:MAG: lasso peptide biosynthesis B2 protein [Bacteroidales bacterium]|nr:lasso peptide biosynthesis B2 protein [Bacteroidales bacterium]
MSELQDYIGDILLIKSTIRYFPWKITCLMESLIVKTYLSKYGFVLPITLGVITAENFRAHAWYCDTEKYGFNEFIRI